MDILSFHHVPFEGLGSMIPLIRKGNHSLRSVNLWEGGVLPDPGDFHLLIVMGGPMAVGDVEAYPWLVEEKRFIREAVEGGMKVLGICLGAQLIAEALGGSVSPGTHREIGRHDVIKGPAAEHCALGRALPERFPAFHWHGDCFSIPPGAVPLGCSEACAAQGFVHEDRIVALQFHLEATPDSAAALIRNCPDELAAGGPYVQSPDIIAGTPRDFEEMNSLMELVWNTLVN